MGTFKLIISLLTCSVIIVACENEDYINPVSNADKLLIGNWNLSELVKGNEDLTSEVSGYVFSCTPGGGMTVQGHGKNFNGNWTCMDTTHGVYNLRIMGCNSNDVLNECMDDWQIIQEDSVHCYFTSHDPSHHRSMTWERIK